MNKGPSWALYAQSSESMTQLADGSVDCVITNPPYSLGEGGTPQSGRAGQKLYRELVGMLGRCFEECHRVLRPGGHFVVTLGTITRDGVHYPLAFEMLGECLADIDGEFERSWVFDDYLICDWGARSGLRVARYLGSRQARDYRPVLTSDLTWVLHKKGTRFPRSEEVLPDLPTSTLWPASWAKGEDHGGQYDPTFADRMVRLYAPPGGLVLDPFAGVCVLGVAAVRAGRRFVGYDTEQKYLDIGAEHLGDIGA